jgi:hypothetical protein
VGAAGETPTMGVVVAVPDRRPLDLPPRSLGLCRRPGRRRQPGRRPIPLSARIVRSPSLSDGRPAWRLPGNVDGSRPHRGPTASCGWRLRHPGETLRHATCQAARWCVTAVSAPRLPCGSPKGRWRAGIPPARLAADPTPTVALQGCIRARRRLLPGELIRWLSHPCCAAGLSHRHSGRISRHRNRCHSKTKRRAGYPAGQVGRLGHSPANL